MTHSVDSRQAIPTQTPALEGAGAGGINQWGSHRGRLRGETTTQIATDRLRRKLSVLSVIMNSFSERFAITVFGEQN